MSDGYVNAKLISSRNANIVRGYQIALIVINEHVKLLASDFRSDESVNRPNKLIGAIFSDCLKTRKTHAFGAIAHSDEIATTRPLNGTYVVGQKIGRWSTS